MLARLQAQKSMLVVSDAKEHLVLDLDFTNADLVCSMHINWREVLLHSGTSPPLFGLTNTQSIQLYGTPSCKISSHIWVLTVSLRRKVPSEAQPKQKVTT
jgi:hypothetical protein